ncbi:MAG TPA: hypothetical protein VGE15_06295 [Sphingobacteriaceae bacterium]
MAQNLDPNLNGPNDQLGKRNLNDIPASDDGIGENTEQTPVAKAQHEASGPSGNEERIPTVTPYNENGLPGPDDEDEDDDTLLDDDDDDEDYEEIIPIEGDDDEPDDNFDDDDDDDDDDIVDHAGSLSVTAGSR